MLLHMPVRISVCVTWFVFNRCSQADHITSVRKIELVVLVAGSKNWEQAMARPATQSRSNGIVKPLFIMLAMCCHSSVNAAIVYDELISGDLPDLNAGTLILKVGVGSNEVMGGLGVYPDTADSFFIDLRGGFRLDSIVVTEFPEPANGYQIGFNLHYADSLRHLSIDEVHLGIDILPLLNPLWGTGFSLPPGNDIVEIHLLQTLSRNAYGFDFVVSQAPVPLPSALFLLVSGILGLVCAGSTRNKSYNHAGKSTA